MLVQRVECHVGVVLRITACLWLALRFEGQKGSHAKARIRERREISLLNAERLGEWVRTPKLEERRRAASEGVAAPKLARLFPFAALRISRPASCTN